ncbi:hypothetical protein Jden_0211 [Jonesia denitrificans DSM 20603]|uniref:Uncharacterized protein n=1 Tax=Jonesia denitrificans (strain ATCC 14870 / DSM 20603 / BCRC 15368 / CIP 55.134 / JCM 11481 / NBRC 15587 / NCTC 10816 / Prevot 55134) TaxID=471856 RepID=C7QYN8_JONDD|nr:hypothetical protein Jden_0211 [Jonesia denitrificans DSM 20603]SQH19858.1 Uncharacterised protein [Jonesia denitrificans]
MVCCVLPVDARGEYGAGWWLVAVASIGAGTDIVWPGQWGDLPMDASPVLGGLRVNFARICKNGHSAHTDRA